VSGLTPQIRQSCRLAGLTPQIRFELDKKRMNKEHKEYKDHTPMRSNGV
jgi:hypothetical protein